MHPCSQVLPLSHPLCRFLKIALEEHSIHFATKNRKYLLFYNSIQDCIGTVLEPKTFPEKLNQMIILLYQNINTENCTLKLTSNIDSQLQILKCSNAEFPSSPIE